VNIWEFDPFQSSDHLFGRFFSIERYSNHIKMHTANLLELLPPELIPFILKYLSIQDLKKCCSINNIWEREVSLELPRRITLWDFQIGKLVQANDMVKDFYSKLKESNKSISYPEELLKNLFLRGLSSENTFKVLIDGLQELALDKIVERLNLK
jgi:hypothetical protein